MKPGFKTSELILIILGVLVSATAAILPFFLDADHAVVQGIALAASTLASLGYGFMRSDVKKKHIEAEAVKAVKADPLAK